MSEFFDNMYSVCCVVLILRIFLVNRSLSETETIKIYRQKQDCFKSEKTMNNTKNGRISPIFSVLPKLKNTGIYGIAYRILEVVLTHH